MHPLTASFHSYMITWRWVHFVFVWFRSAFSLSSSSINASLIHAVDVAFGCLFFPTFFVFWRWFPAKFLHWCNARVSQWHVQRGHVYVSSWRLHGPPPGRYRTCCWQLPQRVYAVPPFVPFLHARLDNGVAGKLTICVPQHNFAHRYFFNINIYTFTDQWFTIQTRHLPTCFQRTLAYPRGFYKRRAPMSRWWIFTAPATTRCRVTHRRRAVHLPYPRTGGTTRSRATSHHNGVCPFFFSSFFKDVKIPRHHRLCIGMCHPLIHQISKNRSTRAFAIAYTGLRRTGVRPPHCFHTHHPASAPRPSAKPPWLVCGGVVWEIQLVSVPSE